MKTIGRFVAAGVVLAGTAAVVWAGFAHGTTTPGGKVDGGVYSDKNGKLEAAIGPGNATWAEASGNMTDVHKVTDHDPGEDDLLKVAAGGAWDKQKFEGLILETESPWWLGVLGSRMNVASSAHQGANFAGKIEAVARGELAIWGSARGLPRAAGAEVVTSSTAQLGRFDLVVDVPSDQPAQVTIPRGKRVVAPGNDIRPGGAWARIGTAAVIDEKSKGLEINYISRAKGSMEIDFVQPGKEHTHFVVDQEDGQWQGLLIAWETKPYLKVLKVFRLK